MYRNGLSKIPQHADDEETIVPGSKIYCVSFGAERVLLATSKDGSQEPRQYNLPNGSVYVMTTQSQQKWRHGIPADDSIYEPRVSHTFRWLEEPVPSGQENTNNQPTNISETEVPLPTRVPPIHRPGYRTSAKTKILFLTDSVLASFPVEDFGNQFECVKRIMYKLTDLPKHTADLGYFDYVFVSAGVNDLSRYDHTAESLSYTITMTLIFNELSWSFPKTTFIFKAILPTDFPWVNRAIQNFNYSMFNYSIERNDFNFFDSYFVNNNVNLIADTGPKANGIHISKPVGQYLSAQIIKHITHLHNHYMSTNEVWPIRPIFRNCLHNGGM